MKKFLIGLGIFVGIVVLIGFMFFGWISGTYNLLVNQRMETKTQWSQVETQYQRRFDLIPNLVAVTKSYLIHEEKVFIEVAQARSRYGSATTNEEKIKSMQVIEKNLAKIMVAIEQYPTLKADQTVKDLMFELSGTENRVNVARQRYNEATQIYDTSLQSFPTNIIGGFFKFEQIELYKSETDASKAPKVDLEIK